MRTMNPDVANVSWALRPQIQCNSGPSKTLCRNTVIDYSFKCEVQYNKPTLNLNRACCEAEKVPDKTTDINHNTGTLKH